MSEPLARRDGPSPEPTALDRPTGRRRTDRIVGVAFATREAVEQALAAARTSLPVRLTGPEGSGRQHLARTIHNWSAREREPFATVACGVTDAPRIGAEIFGCAESTRPPQAEERTGALERAGGGTVFLDSADRLPGATRQSLAKAISEGRFQREGDGAEVPLCARVIVSSPPGAAHSPFGDLPHHSIRLRSLAERQEDVLPLAAHFLRLYADAEGITPVGFTSDARNALMEESWPGNVRELEERVRQAIRIAGSGAITAEALLLAADGDRIPSFKEAKRAFETRYVMSLLRRCSGNISRAARLAKKDRKDFYDVIRRTGIDPADFR